MREAIPFCRRALRLEALEPRQLLTITVNTLADVLDPSDQVVSLRDAIEAAQPGETINFSVTGTIQLDSVLDDLVITKALSIVGPGANLLTIDAGDGADQIPGTGDGFRVFFIVDDQLPSTSVTISGMTLTGGDFEDSEFRNGGAIRTSEDLQVVNCVITGNSVGGGGGGIYARYASVSIMGSTISGNRSTSSGGGVEVSSGNLTVENSTISGNTAVTDSGGGVFVSSGEATILSSTISGNSAPGQGDGGVGGGVAVSNGSLLVRSSTISGNSTLRDGGAIWASEAGVTIEFCTLTGNTALSRGGGAFASYLFARGSMIAGNTAPTGPDVFADSGADVVAEISLIGSNAGSTLTESQTGDQFGNLIGGPAGGVINPLLGPLANNGGPTLTHALLFGSPAIDAGPVVAPGDDNYPLFDQRGEGFSRTVDGDFDGEIRIDMGALEFSRRLVVDTLVDASNGNLAPGDVSLRELIELANANPAFNSIEFDPNLASGRILLAGALPTIVAPMTIDAAQLTGGVIVDAAGGAFRVLTVDDNAVAAIVVTISNLTLRGGNVVGDGGAVLTRENLTLNSVIVENSRATRGGGVFLAGGNLTINRGTIRNNSASANYRSGGGVFVQAGSLAMNSATVSGNTASDGAGLFNEAGDVTILSSTISGNTADDSGGGLYNMRGNLVIRSSTISGNEARDAGGGVYNWSTAEARVAIEFSTITQNTAGRGGGVAANASLNPATPSNPNPDAARVRLLSSVVAGNASGGDLATVGLYVDPARYFSSSGYNMLGSGNAIGAFGGTDFTGIANPGLAPLANNGGPTQTHALLPGSAAIDVGVPAGTPNVVVPTYDQRGNPYVTGIDGNGDDISRSDIGAFEFGQTPVPITLGAGDPLGDFDGSGLVAAADLSHATLGFQAQFGESLSGADLLTWQRHLGEPTAALASASAPADFDANGAVDVDDLSRAGAGWRDRFGLDLSGRDFLAWQRSVDQDAPASVSMATVKSDVAPSLADLAGAVLVGDLKASTAPRDDVRRDAGKLAAQASAAALADDKEAWSLATLHPVLRPEMRHSETAAAGAIADFAWDAALVRVAQEWTLKSPLAE